MEAFGREASAFGKEMKKVQAIKSIGWN